MLNITRRIRKRLAATALLAVAASVLATGIVDPAGTAPPAAAVAGGDIVDDYPYRNPDNSADRWNFFEGQCTSFVAWRIESRLGVPFHNWYGDVRWGDAHRWDEVARGLGFTVTSIPAPGAVAQSDAGAFGHVAWVSRVNSNGTVTVEEYNYGGSLRYGTRTVAASSFEYIYLGLAGKPPKSVGGDRFGDVVAADSGNVLHSYPGGSDGEVGTPRRIGGGWSYPRIGQGDVNGDGRADIYASDGAGNLWHYASTGDHTYAARRDVGNGWTTILRFTMADATGDGRADIIAVRTDGRLAVYPTAANGNVGTASVYGPGWSSMYLFGAGDGNGDGYADIYAANPSDGLLYFYAGTGNGFASPREVGHGWGIFSRIMVNDINGDGRADVLGIKPNGDLWRYTGIGNGTLGASKQIGNGWTTFRVAT
jgi:surface antigen